MKTKRSDWLIPLGLIILSLVPALGGTNRLMQVSAGRVTAENARFLAAPVPIVIHIICATLFSFLGALQFSPGFRKHNRRWHRIAGRVLLPCAIGVAISGLWMTLTYSFPANDGVAVFAERLVFGTAMLVCVALGIESLRKRKFSEHGDWMIRAYAIAMGAGTQVLTHLPWFILVDLKPGITPRTIMMGLGWVINIIFAEWVIRRGGSSRRVDRAPARFIPTRVTA
jgi:putative Mn2+ efflux pump MntP